MKKRLFIVILVSLFMLSGCMGGVKVVKNESSQIQFEKYDNGLVSLIIPKNWKVEVAPVDYIHYSFKVYNPNDKNYMFLFGMKQEGFMKSARARNFQKKYYPSTAFAKLTAINPQTTEEFYKNWNENVKLSNTEELKVEYFPYFNNFKVIDNLGKDSLGGDILRATFVNGDGKISQGIFLATVKSAGSYYISENVLNPFGTKIDVAPLMVYNIIVMTTPDEEFNNWQPILENCLNSITFSQKFLDGFNKEESSLMASIQANQRVYDEISDMIMDSWQKRSNSYDIMSQKRSDATLGYERVYDTSTNEIYKAYNGFTDEYKGNRYKPITDDMYKLPTSGYIEK